jgi:WXG100 family type VII secretion target
MAQYTVTPEELQSTAGNISAASDRIMGEIGAVIQQVQQMRSTWTGNASNTYDGLMGRWKTSADKVKGSLDETILALKTAAGEYADTEQNQVTRFGSGG